jgi:hypothetical protein
MQVPWAVVVRPAGVLRRQASVRDDNMFRLRKTLPPAEEGAALWAAFNAHIEQLYAVMNAGLAAE